MKIDLDSNVFKNQKFIDWLILNNDLFEINISIIVYIETLFWYETRGLSKENLRADLLKINATISEIDTNVAEKTVSQAIKIQNLPFRHHFRDFLIGITSLNRDAIIITNNIRHFTWMPSDKILTPNRLIISITIQQ